MAKETKVAYLASKPAYHFIPADWPTSKFSLWEFYFTQTKIEIIVHDVIEAQTVWRQGLGKKTLVVVVVLSLLVISRVWLVTLWTVVCQALVSMGFSRQEYWSGLPFPSPGDPPELEIEPRSPAFQAESLSTELHRKPLREKTHVLLFYQIHLPQI